MWTPMITQSEEYLLAVLSIYKVFLIFFPGAYHCCSTAGLQKPEGLLFGATGV